MYQQQLKISKERVAVLIGKKAVTKKKIEKATKTELTIDSKEGEVIITGSDSVLVYITKSIIQAIGRGFNPDIALTLLNEDNCLEIIEIKEFANTKKKLIRLKCRVIGTKGKARSTIETLTNTSIVIYGKTISIIGKVENTIIARQAFEMLLRGAPHGNVYKWIEKHKNL